MSSNPDTTALPEQAKAEEEDFSWLPPEPESQIGRLSRKIKENPVVPIGERKLDSG